MTFPQGCGMFSSDPTKACVSWADWATERVENERLRESETELNDQNVALREELDHLVRAIGDLRFQCDAAIASVKRCLKGMQGDAK